MGVYIIYMSKNKYSRKKHRRNKHSNRQAGTGLPKKITGSMFLTSKGIGFVRNPGLPEDIKIYEENLNTALPNDIVEVALISKNKNGRIKGRVKKIIQRSRTQFVGTIKSEGKEKIFEPDDSKIYADFQLAKDKNFSRANQGQKVVIQMKEWNNPHQRPFAKITKILGYKGEHETEMKAFVYEKGFSPEIPENIEREAHKIKEMAPADFESEVQKRISVSNPPPSSWDFRNTTTFTIDPFDAKDFDDALSFKDMGDGTYEVGIHIADVTHYVKEGSTIDKEAIKRGTSIYLVDRTIPMLPEILSNDLCSLNPNTDKLAFSAIFIINKKCEVQKRWFGETIINSDKRFTYKDAQEVIDKGEGKFFTELNTLNELALLKRKRRTKNGAINFGSTEVQFKLDEKGFPIDVYEKEMFETNELIEDYMLLANREVSEYIDRLNKKDGVIHPFVYRIHDKPKQEHIADLQVYLRNIGYELKTDTNGNVSSKDLNDLLDQIQGIDEEDLISKAILKSMAKAVYSTKNIGHYGLAFKHYTHFTSPIRRYPDMMVHRLLKKYLKNEEVPLKETRKYEDLSLISSRQEVLAVEAERNSIKYKYVEYMSQHIGEEFNGIITSITEWGVYVQDIDTKAEGLVNVRTLKGDSYNIDAKNYRLIGQRTGKKYTLGDKVKIKLIKTDLDKRTIDFEIVE